MTAQQIAENGIIYKQLIYVPAVVPADYGGTLFYQLTMHLCDGTAVTHSSCEVERVDGDDPFPAVLGLMRKEILSRNIRPRCDYLDWEKTLAYWKLTGQANQIRYVVSACLAGESCRYDGGSNRVPAIEQLVEEGFALPACPELSGGLPCPRPPCELRGARVVGKDGIDRTAEFQAGAKMMLELGQKFGAKEVICKQRSPSCGCGKIYDGMFSGCLIEGDGLAAALLKSNGIKVTTEEDWQ